LISLKKYLLTSKVNYLKLNFGGSFWMEGNKEANFVIYFAKEFYLIEFSIISEDFTKVEPNCPISIRHAKISYFLC
jgi:hypothetical protein